MKSTACKIVFAAFFLMVAVARAQAVDKMKIEIDQPGITISPRLIGLMTEEINHSYDGGLYAELIQNRIFKDDPASPAHWSLVKHDQSDGAIALDQTDPVNTVALTTSLRLDAHSGRVGAANDGFWGIPVWPATQYTASFWARGSADFAGPVTLDIESSDGQTVFSTAIVPKITTQWQQYTATLATGSVPISAANRFVISISAPGSIWLNLVSLFPPTFNNRPNGNRIDLMKLLADLHPAFLRFPGGNYLEGDTIADRFTWKNTLHGLDQRPGHLGPWGYRSSDGLGLLEFCQWCEDLHMEPLLAVYAGYSLKGEHIPAGPQLAPYVQDALDEIEYITGDPTTPWGAQRAADGHPRPFHLNFVEIGNEDYFDPSQSYDDRFTQFYDAIKARYPKLKLIATAAVGSRRPDLTDDHFYRSHRHMERDAGHYDDQDRGAPHVLVGEWATKEGKPTPNLQAALGDAVWLMGMERNSDLVIMSSYAPLLVNVNSGAYQWTTNLIGYDAVSSFGSPSYYVQKMFSRVRGQRVLPLRIESAESTTAVSPPPPAGACGVGTLMTSAQFKDIAVTSGGATLFQMDSDAAKPSWKMNRGVWILRDGILSQSEASRECRAVAGDSSWRDYSISLKARKLAGENGFTVLFHFHDGENFLRWSIGGWHNTAAAIEQIADGATTQIGNSEPLTVESGKWYDLRIELTGRQIRCFVNGQLTNQATDNPPPPLPTFFALASRAAQGRELFIQAVNTSDHARRIQIELEGFEHFEPWADTEVLTGQPTDSNSTTNPKKIVPHRRDITEVSPIFQHEFPPNSVTQIRLLLQP
ncbi:MAG: alpha-L-arabinofuranosidase C-terminal domain-containing protein [Tepidisphaeraceae bacterium]|jgi:alpha-N-arabinofuranosidase